MSDEVLILNLDEGSESDCFEKILEIIRKHGTVYITTEEPIKVRAIVSNGKPSWEL